ncbi:MAG: hypothetical protein AAGC85_11820 [Bacteroidota bacterium]
MAYTLAKNLIIPPNGKEPTSDERIPFFYQEDISDVINHYNGGKGTNNPLDLELKFKFEYGECIIKPDGTPTGEGNEIPCGVLVVLDKDGQRMLGSDDLVLLGCDPYRRKGEL